MSTAPDIFDLVPADPHADRTMPTAAPKIANVSGRLGNPVANQITATAGLPWTRRLAKAALLIPKIRDFESRFLTLNDEDLATASRALRGRTRGGANLDKFIPEAFGLACAAIRRVHGYQPFDVQLAAGIVMHYGGLVELATGEGKTLSAIAPAYLNALPSKGVHVTTVNDYLAKRDAEEMGPVYRVLGLTIGCLQQKMEDHARQAAYKCDLTYGTGSEFGFDFLRDRMKLRGGQAHANPFWSGWTGGGNKADPRCQRAETPLNFAIVDEADSIFIDEGRTPLVIANPTRPATEEEQVVYKWADKVVKELQPVTHFKIDLKKEKAELTDEGKQVVRYSNPPSGKHAHAMDKLIQHMEKAIMAYHRFRRNEHYYISDEQKVVIIDERTGRAMPDRHWQEGQHQAIEAKEGVPITLQSEHAAQVTYMNFYRLYKKLGGMSGTLMPNFWELRAVYRRWVTKIPTNRPVKREQMPDAVYPTEQTKFTAVVQQIAAHGRPGPAGAGGHPNRGQERGAFQTADRGGHRAPRSERPPGQAGERDRLAGRAAGAGDGGDEHGRAGHRHQARHRRGRRRRAARHRHRAARRRAGGPPARRACRAARRPRLGPVLPVARRLPARRAGEEGGGGFGEGRSGRRQPRLAEFPAAVQAGPEAAGVQAPPPAARPDELRQAPPGAVERPGSGPVCGLIDTRHGAREK